MIKETNGQKIVNRYSNAFKQKVVEEIEEGKYSIAEARKIYDIPGGATVNSWVKKLGKNYLLSKIVRIEMKGEKDKIKELEKQVRELKLALANKELKSFALETLIEVAGESLGMDLKKNFDKQVSEKLGDPNPKKE